MEQPISEPNITPSADPVGDEQRRVAALSFNELLAHEVTTNKLTYAQAILNAFKEGDPSAIKIVNQALLDSQYSEEDVFPIDDKRFEEIVCLLADELRTPQA